ncbi:TBC1 domain family member 13 isoform X2 [Neltuma alba]|uniref:TBC1 domain family member 13 isoform X2 n=1 Tax=Neltuma alba TaxID=207710 RepID=UPI0010A47752|nr:TBC1 domain family member 13-like isoform X2 [Prosopis alba]
MIKGKLKLPAPDKPRSVFPDRLGSLVSGYEGRDDGIEGSDCEFESGKELEPIQPNALGCDQEGDVDNENYDDQVDSNVRQRPIKDVVNPVSVLKAIVMDEKRSDLEHELLLGYLPSSRELWDKELKESREKYAKLKEEILQNPPECTWKQEGESSSGLQQENSDIDGTLRRHEISEQDHPLSSCKASLWREYFQYTEMVAQIDRDLLRTHPDMPFFSGDSSFSRRNKEAMKNILLLFARLNPAIRYVQGMNEVLSPIYYVFSTDTDKENAANAEADSFSCFVRILSDSVDHFCQQLDDSSSGILSTLSRLSELLQINDEELWRHLEFKTKVKPQFYAFRWITLLLTQEFSFDKILRIWDTLLSNPFGIQDMLLRICCAMLLCVKRRLMSGDFVNNLQLLQHYPDDINIEYLLQVAQDISPDTSSNCLSM